MLYNIIFLLKIRKFHEILLSCKLLKFISDKNVQKLFSKLGLPGSSAKIDFGQHYEFGAFVEKGKGRVGFDYFYIFQILLLLLLLSLFIF